MNLLYFCIVSLCAVFQTALAVEGMALQTLDNNFRGGKLVVHYFSNGERKEIFSGHAGGPSFSPDGGQVSFVDCDKKKVSICNIDGSDVRELCVSGTDLAVTYWLPNGYIYFNYHNNEVFRVSVEGGARESVYRSSKEIHQFGISLDAKRMAWTQPGGYKVMVRDMESGDERNFGGGCQGTVSPDGRYVTHNMGGHKECDIHAWSDGSIWKTLRCPEGEFNLHRWAHHSQDYIVYTIEGGSHKGYIHNVQTEKPTAAGAGTIWDFYEQEIEEPSGSGGRPSVAITAPSHNATFPSPSNITVTVEAIDTNGSIVSVEFFEGSTSLGIDNEEPYSIEFDVSDGTYSLSARATDNEGNSRTSSSVTIVVGAGVEGLEKGYVLCSSEGEECTFDGTVNVAYGADGHFNYQYNVSGGRLECSNDVFGDPNSGVEKACYVQQSVANYKPELNAKSQSFSVEHTSEKVIVHLIKKSSGYTELTMHDYKGKLICKGEKSQGRYTFDLGPYASGVYFISLAGRKNSAVVKIVKK